MIVTQPREAQSHQPLNPSNYPLLVTTVKVNASFNSHGCVGQEVCSQLIKGGWCGAKRVMRAKRVMCDVREKT
jgi:hypothetical protein